MPDLQETGNTSLGRPEPYGLGLWREGILKEPKELFVLTESGDLIAVFSTQENLTSYVSLNPTVYVFDIHTDGVKTVERYAKYKVQVVKMDQPRTDA
jgi:hypothetical protein